MASSSAGGQVANPAPLGLAGFALTTLLLSANNAGLLPGSDVWVGWAIFYGGAAQFAAGMWEFKANNTFGATAFGTFGAFWMALAFYVWFWAGKATNVHADLAWMLLGFAIFTGYMMIASFRLKNPPVNWVFIALFITFVLLAAGEFLGQPTLHTLGGWVGIITAALAWYASYLGVAKSIA